jgi:putative ABC transport system substrate-binding protein
MKRRALLAMLAASPAWPIAARAQQQQVPRVIGVLGAGRAADFARLRPAFAEGLAAAGQPVGSGIVLDERWAEGKDDRLPALAANLIKPPMVALLAAGILPALASRKATAVMPVVFVSGAQLAGSGLLQSWGELPANITGVSLAPTLALETQRLELLRQLAPKAGTVGVLINPVFPQITGQLKMLQRAARTLGGPRLIALPAGSVTDIEASLAGFVRQGARVVIVSDDAYGADLRRALIAATQRYKLPALFSGREFAAGGGLVSYGPDLENAYRAAGGYIGRILQRAKPPDLPVLTPDKMHLAVNTGAARALGLTLPPAILERADEKFE